MANKRTYTASQTLEPVPEFSNTVMKHIYFVAETKGSLHGMELRGVEKAKTDCARKLFDRISDGQVRYGVVDSYEALMNLVQCP